MHSYLHHTRRTIIAICCQSPKARSSTQPHSMIDSYILWCWTDIRDRECFTTTAALVRITHVCYAALHSR
jgi:hypothetical protein